MYRGITNPPLRGGKERIRAQTNGCVANKRGGDNLQGRPIPFRGSFPECVRVASLFGKRRAGSRGIERIEAIWRGACT